MAKTAAGQLQRAEVLREINEHLSSLSHPQLADILRPISLPYLVRLNSALDKMKEDIIKCTRDACTEEDK